MLLLKIIEINLYSKAKKGLWRARIEGLQWMNAKSLMVAGWICRGGRSRGNKKLEHR